MYMANGRKENLVDTEEVSFTGPSRLKRYLRMLVRTGLYGTGTGSAAQKIISNVIEEMINDGRLDKIPLDDKEDGQEKASEEKD